MVQPVWASAKAAIEGLGASPGALPACDDQESRKGRSCCCNTSVLKREVAARVERREAVAYG